LSSEVRKRGLDDPLVGEFLSGQPTYLFQEPVWCRVLSALGYEVCYYCLEEDGRIVLSQPAVRMRLAFFRLLYCGLPYGGPVGDVARCGEFMEQLSEVARGEGIHEIRLSKNLYDPAVALPRFTAEEHVQQVLRLGGRTEAEVWSALKKRVRRDVRLAERRGVVVEEVGGREGRDELFRMYAQTMARNETFVVWNREMVEAMWSLLVGAGRGEMLLARHEGKALAGMVTFYSGKRCFYFLGASSGEERTLCPNDATVWEAIRRALAHGCEDFDFMISSREDLSLIEFKEKWGSARHAFLFYERPLARVACLLWRAGFRLARTRLGGHLIRRFRRA